MERAGILLSCKNLSVPPVEMMSKPSFAIPFAKAARLVLSETLMSASFLVFMFDCLFVRVVETDCERSWNFFTDDAAVPSPDRDDFAGSVCEESFVCIV